MTSKGDMPTAIETVNLEKQYGAGQLSVHALHNVNVKFSAANLSLFYALQVQEKPLF